VGSRYAAPEADWQALQETELDVWSEKLPVEVTIAGQARATGLHGP
jgi:hypothetical protein